MNETRRAALSQLAISVDFARAQVEDVLAAERSDVQALQVGRRAALGHQGTGAGGSLHSDPRG